MRLDETLPYRFNPRLRRSDAQVAQSVEQGTENPRVGSSILSLGTNQNNWLAKIAEVRGTDLAPSKLSSMPPEFPEFLPSTTKTPF